MSCSICKLRASGFPTETEYVAFKKLLAGLVENGKLTAIETSKNTPDLMMIYECAKCDERWRLLAPDQAFRGRWERVK